MKVRLINHQNTPTINYKNVKIIKNLTKGLKNNQSLTNSLIIIQGLTMIKRLTLRTRFFELFIENKNLIKQGLFLLEICQNAARSMELATDSRGHDGPS